jgi:hypothetical protein
VEVLACLANGGTAWLLRRDDCCRFLIWNPPMPQASDDDGNRELPEL